MKKLFLSVAALFAVCIVSAQEGVVASYNKGAEMLQSKNYPEAAKLFQKVIDEGMASEDATELNCVETAKKYLVLRDEMRVLEISLWLENLEALKANARKLEIDLRNAEQERDEARSRMDALFAENEQFGQRMQEKDCLLYTSDAADE